MIRKFLSLIILVLSTNCVLANEFTIHKIPNGQTVIIKEIKDNPLITIDTWIKTGSIDETDNNSGVAHFLEHLFFKGTKKYPTGEFDRILESKGAVVNAATSKDYTHYYITIPSAHFDKAMDLHADMLTNPQIPRKELEQERNVVLEEISKDLNNPQKIAYNNLNSLLYTQHPYKKKVIGTADIISTIRREEILDFFNKNYYPSNMITIIVGDIDTNYALESVTKNFKSDYKKESKKHYKKEAYLDCQKRETVYFDSSAGYTYIAFRVPSVESNDTYALDILAQVLGRGKASRLYKVAKEQKGLANTVSTFNYALKEDGLFIIQLTHNGNNTEKLEETIFNEIKQIKKYGITEEELVTAKKMIEQETFFDRESTSDIAKNIGYIMTTTEDSKLYENYIPEINKVLAKDVQAVAQKYLNSNKSAISSVLPKNSKESSTPVETKHAATKISEHKGTTKYTIDNKSTLIINKHDNNDIIAINILAKGGRFLEKTPGEADLVNSVIFRGTKKYSFEELSRLMEENGITIKSEVNEDYILYDIKTTTSQIDLALNILNEVFNNANFNDNEIEKARKELIDNAKRRYDIPVNQAVDNFYTTLYKNTVYATIPETLIYNLPKVAKQNLLDYYNKIFDSKNIVISVNGNIDCDKISNAMGNIFKDRKQPVFNYSNFNMKNRTYPESINKTIPNLQTAWLVLGWQVSGADELKDFVTLKLINTILGNGMSSRMFRNLRDNDGLAYQLGSSHKLKALKGYFVTYIGTNPKNVSICEEKILAEINKLKTEFVSDTELNDAKERLKGSFILLLETNSNKAANIGNFETLGLGYDFLDKYIKMIDEITASDIIKVSNKYFNNNYVKSVVK